MKKQIRYVPEVRDRAIRMVQQQTPSHSSEWAAIESISAMIGCTAEMLRRWVERRKEEETGHPKKNQDTHTPVSKEPTSNRAFALL